jgi:hypothetical protein
VILLLTRCGLRVGKGIALLYHDRGTRRGWVVTSTPRPHFTPGKDPAPILQEAGWAPGPVWTGRKSRPHRDSIPDHPACSQLLYRLSYLAHTKTVVAFCNDNCKLLYRTESACFPSFYKCSVGHQLTLCITTNCFHSEKLASTIIWRNS